MNQRQSVKLRRLYQNIHKWLISHYGKATRCESLDCKGKSTNYSWANKKGYKYEKNRESFFQLCRSCHAFYDIKEDTYEKVSDALKGRTLTPEHRKKILDNMKKAYEKCKKPVYMIGEKEVVFDSITEAGRRTGTSISGISNCLSGKSKTAGGERWAYA